MTPQFPGLVWALYYRLSFSDSYGRGFQKAISIVPNYVSILGRLCANFNRRKRFKLKVCKVGYSGLFVCFSFSSPEPEGAMVDEPYTPQWLHKFVYVSVCLILYNCIRLLCHVKERCYLLSYCTYLD